MNDGGRGKRKKSHPCTEMCNKSGRTGTGEKRWGREKTMAKREVSREDMLRELRRIALSRPNAGIELAYMEKPSRQMIQRLDLSAVSEFRRNSAGAVELRFIDRVKALQALCELLGGGTDEKQTDEFFRALEEAGGEDVPWQR